MKKVWTAFLVGASAAVAAIYLSGNEYIFKAIAINLKKGSLTPSIDDEEKFPSIVINNSNVKYWEKDDTYNTHYLSDRILKDLKKTRCSSLLVICNDKLVLEQYWKRISASIRRELKTVFY